MFVGLPFNALDVWLRFPTTISLTCPPAEHSFATFVLFHKTVCKAEYVLVNTVHELFMKGFCVPPDMVWCCRSPSRLHANVYSHHGACISTCSCSSSLTRFALIQFRRRRALRMSRLAGRWPGWARARARRTSATRSRTRSSSQAQWCVGVVLLILPLYGSGEQLTGTMVCRGFTVLVSSCGLTETMMCGLCWYPRRYSVAGAMVC